MAGAPQPKKRIGGAPFAVQRTSHRPPTPQAPRKAGPPQCARGRLETRPLAAAASRGIQAGSGGAPSSARHPRSDVAEQRIAERRSDSPTAELYATRAERFVEELASGKLANEWTMVQELEAAEQYRRNEDERRKRATGRQKFAAQLRAQEEEQRQQRETRREETKAWAETVKKDVANYQHEQAQTKANLLERHKRLDEDMRRNLEEKERQKKVLRDSEERMDKDILDRQLQAGRRAEEKERCAKRQERERGKFLFEEAERFRRQQFERRQQDAQEDKRLVRESAELAQRQEEQRKAQKEAKFKRIQAQMDRYEVGVRGQLEKQAKADEDRARREHALKEQKDRADEVARTDRLRALNLDANAAIEGQMAEHERRRAEEREEGARRAEALRREAEDALEREEAERLRRRRREQDVAKIVQSQMVENAAKPSSVGQERMTEAERRLNKGLLDRAKDPKYIEAMLQRKKQAYKIQS